MVEKVTEELRYEVLCTYEYDTVLEIGRSVSERHSQFRTVSFGNAMTSYGRWFHSWNSWNLESRRIKQDTHQFYHVE